jgi:hypothetical protein
MHEPELPRIPELTMPAPGVRIASVSVARSPGETANCTPMRRRPRRQLQVCRPLVARASPPFPVWPAYSYLSPGHHGWKRYPAKFKKHRSDFARTGTVGAASAEVYRSLTIPTHPERSSGWCDIDTLPWGLHVACWHMAAEDPTRGELKVCFRLPHIPMIRFCMVSHHRPKDMRIGSLRKPSMELGH